MKTGDYMLKIIFYLFLAFLLWRIVRKVFIGGRTQESRDQQIDNSNRNRTSEIDYKDIEDAKFKDIDNKNH